MECKGILGWIFGHKYQARFDVRPPNIRAEGNTTFIKALRIKTYRGDVCKRCGNLVNKEEK